MKEAPIGHRGSAGAAWLLNHLLRIVWQRRFIMLAAFVVVFLAGVIAAFSLPTVYRSTATLLVQSQDLPSSFIESPANGAFDQRIARIRERVLSRGDLISLIEQNDLYPTERRSQPTSKIIEKMRHSTQVAAVQGDIGQQAGAEKTIAISMSFDYPDPGQAQAVLQSFVSKFLRMDTEDREDQASLTVGFLQDQASKLQSQIMQIERQITELKARNGASLATNSSIPMIDTGSYTAQIVALQNENRQLLAMRRRPGESNNALAAAEAALATVRATFNESHPDVVLARERVEALRRTATAPDVGDSIEEQIAANNADIQSLNAARNAALARASSAAAGQARAPAILEQAMQMESRANSLRQQYQEVSTNLLKAQNSARLASEQRAERLSLIEPPNMPDRPHFPNRPLLIAAGAAAGLALGLLLVLALELLWRPLRSPLQLEALGIPVLGVVPVIRPASAKNRMAFFGARKRRLA